MTLKIIHLLLEGISHDLLVLLANFLSLKYFLLFIYNKVVKFLDILFYLIFRTFQTYNVTIFVMIFIIYTLYT